MNRLLILCALLIASSVQAQEQGELPNMVWINAEDMSPHLGCYGHPDAFTPNIDRLASDGIVYRNAFATAPICSPSRSCLATGLYATSLGTQHLRCEVKIPDSVVPLASHLRAAGYYCTNTGKSDYNFNPQGIWDAWNNDRAPWEKRDPGQPFFAFITVGETHEGRINFRDRYDQATAGLAGHLRHDPETITLPPFYPDTPEIRKIFAGMYDLATVFDQKVGQWMEDLKRDNEIENTIVFIFGDHGNGLPRYKRWLNDSGLRVPLVVYVPERFRHLIPEETTNATDRLVSFVDFPATAMSLAGMEVPDVMQGIPFLGKSAAIPREHVFGARSRADDMFEVSRSVSDGHYIYVKHFLPHLPYIQDSVIFDDRKAAFRELRKLHLAGKLNPHAEKLWARTKPREELYDLKADPHELENLADSPRHREVKERLTRALRHWILTHRDSGFLTESEYQIRAKESHLTPYQVVQNPDRFELNSTLHAAWQVGDESVRESRLEEGMVHVESGVRYWSAVGAIARHSIGDRLTASLVTRLEDESPSVRIAAAEALITSDALPDPLRTRALAALGEAVKDQRPWVSLEAASSLARLGSRAKPLIAIMIEVVQRNQSQPGSARPYKDFNYASFTGWALETALVACGRQTFVDEVRQVKPAPGNK